MEQIMGYHPGPCEWTSWTFGADYAPRSWSRHCRAQLKPEGGPCHSEVRLVVPPEVWASMPEWERDVFLPPPPEFPVRAEVWSALVAEARAMFPDDIDSIAEAAYQAALIAADAAHRVPGNLDVYAGMAARALIKTGEDAVEAGPDAGA
jgi:hypothetical protein